MKWHWAKLHWTKLVLDNKNVSQAPGPYGNVVQNLTLLSRPERMNHHPKAPRKRITNTRPQTETILAERQANKHQQRRPRGAARIQIRRLASWLSPEHSA